jgi:ClpP class serine protease
MDFTTLLLIAFMAAALQPIGRRRLMESARQRVLKQIEGERSSRVILLVHREETMSLLGVPLMRYIDIQDAEDVIRAIRETPPELPIDLVLHTPGGLALPSLQIARALARHEGKVTAFVPHYAMSGGTLIALAADQIVMSRHAVLGPIDPQIGEYPAASILRAVSRKEDKDIEDGTLILADQAEMAINQMRRQVASLLLPRLREDVAEHVANELSTGQWTHDYPITPEELEGLDLPVLTEMPAAIYGLMRLYPQPTRRIPSVEIGPWRPQAEAAKERRRTGNSYR